MLVSARHYERTPPTDEMILFRALTWAARDGVVYRYALACNLFQRTKLHASEAYAKKCYRQLDRVLSSSGLFVKSSCENLVVWSLTDEGKQRTLDLMQGAVGAQQNSNRYTPRSRAKHIARTNLHMGRYVGDDFIEFETAQGLEDAFRQYKDTRQRKRILLKHKLKPKGMLLPYATRFTSPKRRRKHFAQYSSAWKTATALHDEAVFLTLTTDPSNFESIDEAAKHMGKAFNRFMMWLKKYTQEKDIHYIKALEFTKAGYPHLHIALFGIDFIAPPTTRRKVRYLRRARAWDKLKPLYMDSKEHITQRWRATGQGSINYVYTLGKQNDKWRWLKFRPSDAKNRQPVDYLKKYFAKALSDSDSYRVALYWATNTRFYTCSQALNAPTKKSGLPSTWVFVGSFDIEDLLHNLPAWLNIRDGSLIVMDDG